MRLLSDAELAQILDKEIFHKISDAADSLGLECYVVGGYVRDLFLERPSNDIDVVVVGSGIKVADALRRSLGRKAHISVFRNFGTAQVKYKGTEVEFVGARRESYTRGSRKPIVEDGTLEDDQNRRDFTINALAVCLNKDRFGELVDPFDGVYDMEDGIIRTPLDPDITFSDDPLRMLRCIRFATQLNFFIEEETFDALQRNADRIKIISGERVEEELNKIMMTKTPSKGLVDLQRCGLLPLIMPELSALDIIETKNGRAHKNNFYHTLEVLDNVSRRSDNLWLRWAALMHDIGKARSKRWDPIAGWTFHNHNFIGAKMVPRIFARLKLPMGAEMRRVKRLVDLHMRPIALVEDEVTDSAVRRLINYAEDDLGALMILARADITSKNIEKKQRFLDNFDIVERKFADINALDAERAFRPALNGYDIMAMFGLTQGPTVGMLMSNLTRVSRDCEIEPTRQAAIDYLMDLGAQNGLKGDPSKLPTPPEDTDTESIFTDMAPQQSEQSTD